MDETSNTVQDHIDRFVLRRRAASSEFRAGVQLARKGRVTLIEVTDAQVRAVVSDRESHEVTVVADEAAGLTGRCECDLSTHEVCRHQVAATHALWMQRKATAR